MKSIKFLFAFLVAPALAFWPGASPVVGVSKHASPAAATCPVCGVKPATPKTMLYAAADGAADERAEAVNKIKDLVGKNKVMLFMKGTKLFPQCGFSNTAVSILRAIDAEFETFDVLSDMVVREEIKTFSSWPTIPQCYIDGEFVGGSDILLQMYESGELEDMIAKAKK